MTISGNQKSRILFIRGGVTARVSGLTLANGFSTSGGAIRSDGRLTLTDDTVRTTWLGATVAAGASGSTQVR